MKKILLFVLLLLASTTTWPQNFKTIKIGDKTWMAENLNVSTFSNGDPIAEAKTADEWKAAGEAGKPAWCYYNNDTANGRIYGKLYNGFAVNDPRGLAPKGWHVSSREDWYHLINTIGEVDKNYKPKYEEMSTNFSLDTVYTSAMKKIGPKLRTTTGWGDQWTAKNHITITSATNQTGFSALPAGYRDNSTNWFIGLKTNAQFWTTYTYQAPFYGTMNRTFALDTYNVELKDGGSNLPNGNSVRCVKD